MQPTTLYLGPRCVAPNVTGDGHLDGHDVRLRVCCSLHPKPQGRRHSRRVTRCTWRGEKLCILWQRHENFSLLRITSLRKQYRTPDKNRGNEKSGSDLQEYKNFENRHTEVCSERTPSQPSSALVFLIRCLHGVKPHSNTLVTSYSYNSCRPQTAVSQRRDVLTAVSGEGGS